MLEAILKCFDEPDDVAHFRKGKFETVTLGGMTIGRAPAGIGLLTGLRRVLGPRNQLCGEYQRRADERECHEQ